MKKTKEILSPYEFLRKKREGRSEVKKYEKLEREEKRESYAKAHPVRSVLKAETAYLFRPRKINEKLRRKSAHQLSNLSMNI